MKYVKYSSGDGFVISDVYNKWYYNSTFPLLPVCIHRVGDVFNPDSFHLRWLNLNIADRDICEVCFKINLQPNYGTIQIQLAYINLGIVLYKFPWENNILNRVSGFSEDKSVGDRVLYYFETTKHIYQIKKTDLNDSGVVLRIYKKQTNIITKFIRRFGIEIDNYPIKDIEDMDEILKIIQCEISKSERLKFEATLFKGVI